MVNVSYWNDLEAQERAFFREESPIKWPTFPLDLHSVKMIYKRILLLLLLLLLLL